MTVLRMLVGIAMFVLCMAGIAEESIGDRANYVASRLEGLNELGGECVSDLHRHGTEGEQAKGCSAFFGKLYGDYGTEIQSECAELKKWYRAKRKYAAQNADMIERNPAEAVALMKDMKAYINACEPEGLKQHTEIKTAVRLLKAMKEQEAAGK